jgi:hypothetical protein
MLKYVWYAAISSMAMTATACNGGLDQPEVTYWQDVAPILFENCVNCHQPGGIGPFGLDNYDEAQAWSAAVIQAVEARTMPPWLVTSDGSCGEFHDSKWLADEDIETIANWIAAGTSEGTPRADLRVPAASQPGIELDDGSAEIMAVNTPVYVPEPDGTSYAKYDDYRCFLLDGAIEAPRFITGYELAPGNHAMVHHAILMVVDPDRPVAGGATNMDVMRALDDASPDRLGWSCHGLAGEGVAVDSVPVTWAPGMGPVRYPAKTGVRLPAGRVFVVQMHYNLVDEAVRGQSDSTLIRLRVTDQVEREGMFALPDLLVDSGDMLEPGLESRPYTWELDLAGPLTALGVDRMDVYGVFPHMHELGRRFRMEFVDKAGEAQCAAEITDWSFGWQLFYFYEQPIEITRDTRMRVTCDYDTRGRTEPTMPGLGTQNEMCMGGLYLVFP